MFRARLVYHKDMRERRVLGITILLLLLWLAFRQQAGGRPVSYSGPNEYDNAGYYVEFVETGCERRATGVRFAGVVENTHAARSIRRVHLRGVLVDADGRELNTNWAVVASDRIAPGGSSTYSFWLDDAQGVSSCHTRVEGAEFTR